MTPTGLWRTGPQDTPDITKVTVAAIDESISSLPNLPSDHRTIYQAIVCSPPDTPSRKELPPVKQAFEDSHASGLLIEHFAVTPSTIEEYSGRKSRSPKLNFQEQNLNRGFNMLLQDTQQKLEQEGYPRIGILYFDGGPPNWLDWWNFPSRLGIKVVYARKNENHSYNQELDPFGKGLLTLADGIAGILRKEGDRLESMV